MTRILTIIALLFATPMSGCATYNSQYNNAERTTIHPIWYVLAGVVIASAVSGGSDKSTATQSEERDCYWVSGPTVNGQITGSTICD